MYWEVVGNHMWRVYKASQISPLTPLWGSNWGHKIANFIFPLISPLFLLLELENVLRGIGKPYVKSLDSRSYLPPRPSLMGQTGVIKWPILCFCLLSPLFMLLEL